MPGSSSGRSTARIVARRPRQRQRQWFSALVAGALAAELIAGTAVLICAPAQPAPLAAPTGSGATTAPPSVVVAGHTVRLAGGSGTEPLLARVAADIGPAIDAVTAFWGVDWPRDITVVATGSDSHFRAEAGGGTAAQWADIAAVAVADSVDPAHRTAVGQRIVFAPGAAAMRELALRIVLSHELFHYAARVDTALDAPRWLTEGVADFVARPQTAVPEAIRLPTALPSDADLDAPGPQRSLAYDRAWWFTRFIADAYGTATLRQFYLAACGVGHAEHVVDGTDMAALLARWQRWLSG